MKKLPFLFAVAGLLAVAWTPSGAAEPGGWYITGMGSYIIDDEDRIVEEDWSGVHVGLGKALNEYWNVEFNAVGTFFDGFPDQDQWGLGADFQRVYNRSGRMSPYFLGGIGFLKTNPSFGDNFTNATGSYGVGLRIGLPKATGTSLRAEARARHEFGDQDLQELVFSIGFATPIGSAPPPPDSDGDGVPNDADRCPGTPAGAVVDARGCEIDSDGDGVVDSKDKCPNTKRGAKVDDRGCEIVADTDSDGDGVVDAKDRCPNTPRGARVDARGCELDSDGDGVVDSKDRCPNTRAGVRVDVNGCEIKETINLPGVTFELNSANLTAGSTSILDEAAATLRKHPDLVVEVAGHTDSTGDAGYNETLSQRRAEAVLRYLVGKGANGANLTARGYGEANPIADNSTREGRARNRRVELTILKR